MTPILSNGSELLQRYDVLFCDVWGVVHNGVTAYVDGCAALARFREQGGTVVLVSNAPRQPVSVAKVLAEKNVPRDAWDIIVSSGGIAVKHAEQEGLKQVYHLGPDRDLDIFDGTSLTRAALEDADAILCTGLLKDRTETGEDYRAKLNAQAAARLPFVCANPDLVVDVGAVRLPCAGAIAAVYEDMGGPVFWAGKPFPIAYESALVAAQTMRDGPVAKDRILAIGDSVRTDMAGAADFGIDALFIGQGIHHEAVAPDGALEPGRFAALLDAHPVLARAPVGAMLTLAW